MPILPITELGDEILRKPTSAVQDWHGSQLQQLIDDMLETVKAVKGVGLAAPQVGHSVQLFIIASHPNARYPDAPNMDAHEVINPKIISLSDDTELGREGCLSIPRIRCHVPRSLRIEVEFYDRNGAKRSATYMGFPARIFQHEYDHLYGTVIFDRLESNKDIITDNEYKKLV